MLADDGSLRAPAGRKSDYDLLVRNEGGPVRLLSLREEQERSLEYLLRDAASELSFDLIEEMLRPFQIGGSTARRHWPWIALVARTYRHSWNKAEATKERKMKPSEMSATLRRVGELAQRLHDELRALEGSRVVVGQPVLTGHLHEIWYALAYGAAGTIGRTRPPDNASLQELVKHHRELQATLLRIPAAAKFAASLMHLDTLRKKGGGGDPALPHLVEMASLIWRSMTHRPPSVRRVSSRSRQSDSPDFVLFVQSIASLPVNNPDQYDAETPHNSTGPIPSISQIATAFRALTSV